MLERERESRHLFSVPDLKTDRVGYSPSHSGRVNVAIPLWVGGLVSEPSLSGLEGTARPLVNTSREREREKKRENGFQDNVVNGVPSVLRPVSSPMLPSKDKSSEVCKSQGRRFPQFSFEGHPPKKAKKGPKDLTLCRVFRKSTCCDATQTYPALLSVRKLASFGEASEECLNLWELLECSICDPRVGVRQGPPVICVSLCDSIFEACSNAYFAVDGKTQVLSPCGSRDILCGRVSEIVSNGSELCRTAGFFIHQSGSSHHIIEESCYGGKATFDSVSDSWRQSKSESAEEAEEFGVLNDFHQWTAQMTFIEKVSWAVGGLVLTSGLLLFSRRKRCNRRQKQAALYRATQRMRREWVSR